MSKRKQSASLRNYGIPSRTELRELQMQQLLEKFEADKPQSHLVRFLSFFSRKYDAFVKAPKTYSKSLSSALFT